MAFRLGVKKILIIGFGHRRRAGKDTAARFLATWIRQNNKGISVVRKGFADKLYATCHSLYGWAGFQTREYYADHPEEKEIILVAIGKSPRDILIEVGNYMRKVYSRTWIDHLLMTKADILIIPDVRYYNEAKAIFQLNGFVYKIDRPDEEKFDDQADSALQDFDEWTDIITNNGDLKQFHDQVIEQVALKHFNR